MFLEFLLKLGIAILVGGLIGLEREYQDKAAGFRTIILITIGSTLSMLFSISIANHTDSTTHLERFAGTNIICNSDRHSPVCVWPKCANSAQCWNRDYRKLDGTGDNLIRAAMSQLNLSARAYHRILKLARMIADLAGSEQVQTPHLAEALQYRPKGMNF